MAIGSDYHFNILVRLLRIVTTDSLGKTGFPVRTDDDHSRPLSMQDQLLRGILEGRFTCDEEAAAKLYDAPPTDQRYQTLRTRCIDRMFNAIANIELSSTKYSEYMCNYVKCLDLFRASTLLGSRSNLLVAEYGFTRALAIAKKYELTEFEYLIRSFLTNTSALSIDEHGNREHHTAMFELMRTMEYEQLSVATLDLLITESDTVRFRVPSSTAPLELTRTQALDVLEACDPRYRTHTIVINQFRLQVAQFLSIRMYERALEVYGNWLDFYKVNPTFAHRAGIGEVHIGVLDCTLRMRRLTHSDDVYNPCDYFNIGKTNWCASNILTIHAYLYLCDYAKAYSTYINLKTHYSDAVYPAFVYEWRMLTEAYLWIATSILEPTAFGTPDPRAAIPFRLTTFLNAMTAFTGDKYSLNPLIIIAHAFVLLIQRNDAEAERRIMYLNVYATRYLKGESEQRLWNCVKAMQKILALRDRPRVLRRVMAPYVERIRELAHLPMGETRNEIIPWDVLLEAYVDWEERRLTSASSLSH